MSSENDESRPLAGAARNVNSNDTFTVLPTTDSGLDIGCQHLTTDVRAADLALRCAWLRAHGHHVLAFDPTGGPSAQLFDLADLLEIADERRWFG